MKRTLAALAACLFALAMLAGCARDPLVSQESYVFGTRVEILVWGESEATARTAINAALREFDRLHRTYHAWQPSELTALNASIAAGRTHTASAELAGLLRQAQALAARGDHLFDPGIGALIRLWGFQNDEFKAELPDPAVLTKLVAARPSMADLVIDGDMVKSRNPQVAVDFGGYLKGVALDRAAAILRENHVTSALINIGGNVMALGDKGGKPWRVGVQHPRLSTPQVALNLKNGEAIGTSGDYQRYFMLDGRRYCHLIDPRSGAPAGATQALTVLIPPRPDAGTWSDWASKPLFIAGDDWRPLAERLGIDYVLRIDATGRVEMSEAFAQRVTLESKP
jgi:thiamine biosynthesis lipoprotein